MSAATNILLITADSLRADFVGCCRAEGRGLTPRLDAFAADALVFTNAVAQGTYTTMSMPALFAGAAPSRLRPFAFGGEHGVLLSDHPTLAEVLMNAGYRTAGFHSNPYLSKAFGFDRGFHEFYDDVLLAPSQSHVRFHLLLYRLRRLVRSRPYLPARGLNKRVRAWLGRREEPFFVWVHYMDTHGPYQSDPDFRLAARMREEALWRKAIRRPQTLSPSERDHLVGAYRRAVSHLDRELGVLFCDLAARGVIDRTAVIVSADHGEEFFEHGKFGHSNGPYDELIKVPLLIRVPGLAGRTIDTVVSLVDVAPTILELIGAASPAHFEGRSLLRFLNGGAGLAAPVAIAEQTLAPYVAAVRTPEWKLIVREDGHQELYALAADPREAHDVLAEHRDVAQTLERRLASHRGTVVESTSLSVDEEDLVTKRLRDLGYL